MSGDRFARVMEAFERAVEADPGERHALVERLLGDDPDALVEVRDLLAHHDVAEGRSRTGGSGGGDGGSGSGGGGGGGGGGGNGGMDAAAEAEGAAGGLLMGVATAGGLRVAERQAGVMEDDSAAVPVLAGTYRIIRRIGEGGMGVVYEAEQAFPRRRVALKALRSGLGVGGRRGLVRRFRNEIELLGRLQHPGIAQLYEAGVAEPGAADQAFFAMELVEGKPLTAFAREAGLSQAERWGVLLKVCEAVQHAHQRGVIHRDLKPGNILVGADRQPKVVDFGIARAVEGSAQHSLATLTGQLVGTPAYMSPEQMAGKDVDTRTDVYALGVVGYELLAGRTPFDLTRVPLAEASRIIREEEPPPLGRDDRTLRGDPEVIIAKAMAKEPDRRYASAAELAEDIRRLLAGDAIVARRDSAMYLLAKGVRRHRTAARLVLAGLVGLVGFAVYATLAAQEQGRLAEAATTAQQQERAAKEAALALQAEATRARDKEVEAREAAVAAQKAALAELTQASIERGRFEAATGNLALAEDSLWRHYLAEPTLPSAYWGLWELYDRIPSRWAKQMGTVTTAASAVRAQMVAWMRDASRLVVVSAESGDVLVRMTLTPDTGTLLAFAPAADWLVTGSTRHVLRVIPVDVGGGPEGEAVVGEGRTLPESLGARLAVFSGDGQLLAGVVGDNVVRVWSVETGRVVNAWVAPGVVRALAWGVVGGEAVLAVGGDPAVGGVGPAVGRLGVWSVERGELVADLSGWQRVRVAAMAFVGDRRSGDQQLVVGELWGRLGLWTPGQGAAAMPSREYIGLGTLLSLVPTADGRRLLALTQSRPFLVDARLGLEVTALPRLRWGARAGLWVGSGGEELTLLTADGVLRRLGTQPNPSARRIGGFEGWCFSVAYSPDGEHLAVGTDTSTVEVFGSGDGVRRMLWRGPAIAGFRTRGLRFIDGGRRLLAISQDGVLRVLDAAGGQVLASMPSERSELFALAVSPDEKVAAVGHADRTTRLFDLASGSPLVTLPKVEKRVEGLAFSPDGRLLAVSGDVRSVAIWEMGGGSEVGPTGATGFARKLATTSQPWAVGFSPDGARLLVTTQAGTIEVFDTRDWKRTHVIQGHQRLIPALAISADGRFFATGGEDELVKLWDLASLRNLASFDTEGQVVVTLDFSRDGRYLAGSAANRFVVQYDLRSSDERIKAHEAFAKQSLSR